MWLDNERIEQAALRDPARGSPTARHGRPVGTLQGPEPLNAKARVTPALPSRNQSVKRALRDASTCRLVAPLGASLAIAIRRENRRGARGRDRTLGLPVIRLRPRTLTVVDRGYGKRGASLCSCSCTSLKCPHFCIAYRKACRRASRPTKISNSQRPSSSNHSTRHWPGVARSSKTFAGSAPGWVVFVIMSGSEEVPMRRHARGPAAPPRSGGLGTEDESRSENARGACLVHAY